jgi:hypothetical protein
MKKHILVAATLIFAACSSGTAVPNGGDAGSDTQTDGDSVDADNRQQDANGSDATSGSQDALGGQDAIVGQDASVSQDASSSADAMTTGQGDGTPMRNACTGNFGNALDTQFGRLDGYLVSIVRPGGSHSCNGDSGHVHFQVLIQGSVYDVAVNTDTQQVSRDVGLPDGDWNEGWHTNMRLDYVALGLHDTDFSNPAPDAASAIESFVANANHVSIFATGYGPTGAHDVHRRNGGNDGAIIIDPLSSSPHALFFRFTTQSF